MTDQSQTPNRALWVGAALVLSLVVNAFFVGLWAGGHLPGHDGFGIGGPPPHEGRHGAAPDLDPRALTHMLPPGAREDARDLMEAQGPALRELFRAAATSRAEAFEAMRAEPFDEAALNGALAASRQADDVARAAAHALMAEIVAGLTAEERAKIGDDLGERFPRFHEGRERHERFRERRRPPPEEQTP